MTLALSRRRPTGRARRAALLTHAMMADGGYLAGLAGTLAASGIDTFVLDFRGHGRSVPPSPRRERWSFDVYFRQDVPAAVAAVAAASGKPPAELAYLGHSLGGLAGVAAFGSGAAPRPARLVLVATTPWDGGGLARTGLTMALAVWARTLGHLPVRAARAGTADENPAYLAELARWPRDGRWPYDAAVGCPALLVASSRDPYCSPDDARAFGHRIGGDRRMMAVRSRGHFGFFRRGEEALWDEIAGFMQ